jgi:glycosyltransferase involved in cell wall biosynthesis
LATILAEQQEAMDQWGPKIPGHQNDRLTLMRILFLIPSLEGGGAERQLSYLAKDLTRFGVNVHVGYLREGPYLQPLQEAGVSTHCLGPLSNSSPLLPWKIHQLIRRVQPKLIQTWLTQMDILGGLAASWSRIPFVLSERTSSAFYTTNWKDRLRVAIGKRANAIVANSNGGIEYWQVQGQPNGQIRRVIRNAIPFDALAAATPVDAHEAIQFRYRELILFAGRMVSIKNLAALVPALITVLKQRQETIAVLMGNGPLASDCALQAEASGLSTRLRVLPFSDRILGWFKRADLFVSVSQFEGNPNAVLEAAACGCPLVLSDIPAHRELFDDRSALFVRGRSSEAIAAGIVDTLEDRVTARTRAEQARNTVASRTSDAYARQYLALYQDVFNRDVFDHE